MVSRSGLRIVWAIAAKDIADAVRNKTTLFNILTVFLLMAMYQWFSSLMYSNDDLLVYDAGSSRLVTLLENSSRYRLRRVNSIQELMDEMSTDHEGQLGLVIPSDFDQHRASATLDAGDEPTLSGYSMWSSRSDVAGLTSAFEQHLTELVGQPVQIDVKGTVYPQPDSMGPIRMVSIILVLTIIFMGVLTVPHLVFEEKRTRTLDALLISPASISQVVFGKAVAGLFYCLTSVGVVFVFNWSFVVHWWLALVAVLTGALLAVGCGLLLGTYLERREQMMIWALIPSYFFLGPVFLSVIDPILPEALRVAFSWIPTVALALLFRYSFSDGATLVQVMMRLGIVVVSVGMVLALVVHKVRRLDR